MKKRRFRTMRLLNHPAFEIKANGMGELTLIFTEYNTPPTSDKRVTIVLRPCAVAVIARMLWKILLGQEREARVNRRALEKGGGDGQC